MEEEIKIWKEEIESITIEVAFYQKVLNSYLIKRDALSPGDISFFEQIRFINKENQGYYENLITLINRLVQLKECDDMQCEMYFSNKHAEFKSNVEMYFSKYRKFKKEILECLNGWVEDFVIIGFHSEKNETTQF